MKTELLLAISKNWRLRAKHCKESADAIMIRQRKVAAILFGEGGAYESCANELDAVLKSMKDSK